MYIVSSDNKIIAVYDAQNDREIKKLHPGSVVSVAPDTCTARTGEDIRQFDANGERKSDESCIIAGYMPCPADKVIDGKTLRDKSLKEKYADGTLTMPEGFKLNAANDGIEPMTPEEKKAAGLITDAEYKAAKNAVVCAAIYEKEAKQNRAIREHILGDSAAKKRIETIESEIVNLRSTLI